MMHKHLFLLIFSLISFLGYSQFANKKVYNIERVQNTPKIDGELNDNVWTNLTVAKNFSQISPNNGTPEREHQRTEIKICYDSKNIYFGIMMYDNAPDSILTELGIRDEKDVNSDLFGIFIDPFNNGQMEYNFSITAAGVQIDRKFSKTGIDKTWDAVWKSAIKINNEGWIAELAIPFSQIRFPNNTLQAMVKQPTAMLWVPVSNSTSRISRFP